MSSRADHIDTALTKFKSMLDKGLITQAAFDKERAELMALPQEWLPPQLPAQTDESSSSDFTKAYLESKKKEVLSANNRAFARAEAAQNHLEKYTGKYGEDGSEERASAVEQLVKQFADAADSGELEPNTSTVLGACMFDDAKAQMLIADLHLNPPPAPAAGGESPLVVYNSYVITALIKMYPASNFAAWQWSYVHLKYPLFPPVKQLVKANLSLLRDKNAYATTNPTPAPEGAGFFEPATPLEGSRLPKPFAKSGSEVPAVFGGAPYWLPVVKDPQGRDAVNAAELQELGQCVNGMEHNIMEYCNNNDNRINNLERMVTEAGITNEKGKPMKEVIEEMRKKTESTRRTVSSLAQKVKNTQWVQSMMVGQRKSDRRPSKRRF